MLKRLLPIAVAVCVTAGRAWAAPASDPHAPDDGLYRMTLLRAAPGRLLELVATVKGRAALVLRHSQGDQWDLMLLVPVAGAAAPLPGASEPRVPEELVAWREDELVRGPAWASLEGFATAGLYHVEMFVALPGKRAELLKQREMENAYARALGRPLNAIFVREWGAAWDTFTIGAYRGWKHWAESEDIPAERSSAAAVAAGFEGGDRIGSYLRALIQSHHDTLATPVR